MRLYPASFAHGPFAFNAHRAADGSAVPGNAQNTVTIDRRETSVMFREGREPYHLATGGALGRVHKGFALLRLNGRILVPDAAQEASLADKESAMRAAFDPELCYQDSPSTDGAYAFDFSEATTDTATYPLGRIDQRYYCRPMAQPTIVEDLKQKHLNYALGLIAADPRRYEQALRTLVLTPASPSGVVTNPGTVRSPLRVVLDMAGAGSANFTLTRNGVAFALDLSTTLPSVVEVVMETCGPFGAGRRVAQNGTINRFSWKTSGPSTWLDVPVGPTTFAIANATNVTSCTLSWRGAWA